MSIYGYLVFFREEISEDYGGLQKSSLWRNLLKSYKIFCNLIHMKKINEPFVCIQCGKTVPLAKKTCRNHCPFCFTSLHVDGEIP